MSIEIIPPGSSAVVTDRDRDRHHDHDDKGDRYRNHDRFSDVRSDIRDSRYDVVNEMNENFKDTGNQVERGFTASALSSCKTDDAICELGKDVTANVRNASALDSAQWAQTQKQVSDFYSATLLEAAKNAAALSVQSQKESNDLSNQATQNFNSASVQREKDFNALTVQSTLNQYNILLDAQKNASASVLLQTQIAAAAAAQAAECCCELKEKIGDEGQKTRDLINAVQASELRDRAVRSETALAAYFAAKTAPSAPVI